MALQKWKVRYWTAPKACFFPATYVGDEAFASAVRTKLAEIEGYIVNEGGGDSLSSSSFVDPEYGPVMNAPKWYWIVTTVSKGRDVYKPGASGLPEIGQCAKKAVLIFEHQLLRDGDGNIVGLQHA
jgi:hypothetical protein